MTRLSARLGRLALLLQLEALGQLDTLDEPVVFDHFETFVFSQDDRLGIGTAVGQRSWFVYAFDPAPHRRAGRRAAHRPALRSALPPPVLGSVKRSTSRVLRLLRTLNSAAIPFVTDDHPAYRSAVADAGGTIVHEVHPNPPRGPGHDPAPARTRDRAMFAVDLLHKLWRHSQAHHRRETIAFGRRANAVVERAALMVVWRNFVKSVSERRNDPTTPAMRLKVATRAWSWRDVLSKRRFPQRTRWPEGWLKVYKRRWITPAVGRNATHDLRHAF